MPELWLAQALAKGDRDELADAGGDRAGVAGVIPWAAERSVSRWEGAKAEKGRERWASIVREASEAVDPGVGADGRLDRLDIGPHDVAGPDSRAEPDADVPLTEIALAADRITLVVGPEGGIARASSRL